MSKTKAFICSALLMIVILTLLIVSMLIESNGFSLYRFLTGWITGMYIADKTIDFYFWLQKDE